MRVSKTLRYDADQLAELQRSADQRTMSLTAVIEEACAGYLQGQQLASDLADMEARLAATLVRQQKDLGRVADDVQLLMALIDQLTRFVFAATPEVVDKQAAAIVGNRRHAAFMSELPKVFNTRRKRSEISEKLEGEGGDDE